MFDTGVTHALAQTKTFDRNIPVAIEDARLGAEFRRDLNYFELENPKEYSLYFEGFPIQNNLKVDLKSDASSRIFNGDRYSDLYGKSFEHWIAMELNSYLSYRRMRESLFFWRSKHQHEMDFTIDDQIAIETKATKRVTSYDLKNLKVLEEENIFRDYFLVSHDTIEKKQGSIYCMHWEHFIEKSTSMSDIFRHTGDL